MRNKQTPAANKEVFAFRVDGRVLEVKATDRDFAIEYVNRGYMDQHWSGRPFAWMDGPTENEFIAVEGEFDAGI